MSVPQRSPLPWAVCQTAPNDQWYPGRTIYSVPDETRIGDATPLSFSSEINAAFIVKACNSHDEMLASIKALRGALQLYMTTYVDTQTHPTPGQEAVVMATARGALRRTAKWEEA